jgi:hypothetical protein
MTPRRIALIATLLFGLPAGVGAQDASSQGPVGPSEGGTYVKIGLAHWQGDIFSGQSLTRWNGSPFGSDYKLTSLEIEIETYFSRTRLLLSGWSIGYRKDALGRRDSGHVVHASAFRSFDLRAFELRAGGGLEWGVPSLNFDTTTFDYRADGALRYSHTYPVKNADVPGLGTTKDGALYPFVEASVVERIGPLLFEGGMRVNLVRFQFDTYQVDLNDHVAYRFSNRRVLMPMLFVDVGFRVF